MLYGGFPITTKMLACFCFSTLFCVFLSEQRGLFRLSFEELERIYHTDSRKRLILARSLEVGMLDVHAGDVMGEQHDFVTVQLVFVFVLQVAWLL